MTDWLILLIIIVAWGALQYIVFPKLGLPS
jgi:hypothetical protein